MQQCSHLAIKGPEVEDCRCVRYWMWMHCSINERMTYILLHVSTIYLALYSIMELGGGELSKYEIPCLNILYIQINFYLLSILHISLQIQYDLNLKIRKDRNHYRHTSSVHRTYRHICYSCVQLLSNLNREISCAVYMLSGTCLQTKRRVRRNA